MAPRQYHDRFGAHFAELKKEMADHHWEALGFSSVFFWLHEFVPQRRFRKAPFKNAKQSSSKRATLNFFRRDLFFGHCMFETIFWEDIDWKNEEDIDLWEDAWAFCFHSNR